MNKLVLAFIILTASCTSQPKATSKNEKKPSPKINSVNYKINLELNGSKVYTIGETIEVGFKTNAKTDPDSVVLKVANKNVASYTVSPCLWNTIDAKVGNQKMIFTFFWGDSIRQTVSKKVTILSDIEPPVYGYKVIKTWPHDTKAYTQGLEFNDGYLYEGTGQYGESMLTKIKLETSEIIQSINLPKEVFGEGITILNDKVFQLTWKSSIGFVYDKTTFNTLYEFSYPTDGWGLTNNGKELIMSDGSENIYYLDSEYFNELRRIQVYDNNGPVLNLNELELINGMVYANIYGTKRIVVFDPVSGKVQKYIDLTGILKKEDIHGRIDVMNGIAWEPTKQMLLVTGKWWPKFYQIEVMQ